MKNFKLKRAKQGDNVFKLSSSDGLTLQFKPRKNGKYFAILEPGTQFEEQIRVSGVKHGTS